MLIRAVNDYLALRRGLGFKLEDTGKLLMSFSDYAAERGEQVLIAETAVGWAALGSSVHRRHRRLRTLDLFADYLRTEDTRHERIPIEHFPLVTGPRRFPPRIFSVEEIECVLNLTSQLWPTYSIRPLTYRTLIGLLFSTGMRISEALNLRLIDIQSDSLTIRKTKFGKSRWLPLHQTTVEALEHYLSKRNALKSSSDRLFLSWRRQLPLGSKSVLVTFQELCAQAGINGAGARRKPRLHDLSYPNLHNIHTYDLVC